MCLLCILGFCQKISQNILAPCWGFLFSVWFKMNQFGKVPKKWEAWGGGFTRINFSDLFPPIRWGGCTAIKALQRPAFLLFIACSTRLARTVWWTPKLVHFEPAVTNQNHTYFWSGQGKFAKLVHFEPVSTSPVLSAITLGRILSFSASEILCSSVLGNRLVCTCIWVATNRSRRLFFSWRCRHPSGL